MITPLGQSAGDRACEILQHRVRLN
ncbi:hypothetical protein RHRU231_820117 [Rhodococcus ruber]|uniref:Uncharacterized protein n=1 Tax=Rhodococcus ruber TaxID=1830 RepID=A0A098BSY6_9NOCA|nr:hypothetical protein RHRU231_820117 [Rhodococcus ruber]